MAATYGDVAEFFVVYIKEAHAADSPRPVPIQGEATIYEPKSLTERNTLAKKCVTKLKLNMPCLVDAMDDAVGAAYKAWPDRIYVVDTDGKIAVKAERGPWGFKPGVEDTKKWLADRFPGHGNSTN